MSMGYLVVWLSWDIQVKFCSDAKDLASGVKWFYCNMATLPTDIVDFKEEIEIIMRTKAVRWALFAVVGDHKHEENFLKPLFEKLKAQYPPGSSEYESLVYDTTYIVTPPPKVTKK